MSIAQFTNKKQDLAKVFGENQGYWEYRDKDDNWICYVVRKKNHATGKKYFLPYVIQNGNWATEWHKDQSGKTLIRPIYNVKELYDRPHAPVLLVEGEKTADAGKRYFPEMVCVTWLGGSGMVENFEINHLAGREIYFVPDPDAAGDKAAKKLLKILTEMNNIIHLAEVRKLGVDEGWDIANLDDEHGNIDVEVALQFIREAPIYRSPKPIFDLLSYPHLSDSSHPKPLDTTENWGHLLQFFEIYIRWNMLKRVREVRVPDIKFYEEESENQSLTYLTNLAVLHGLKINRADKHLDALAWENLYHPVKDWILSAPLTSKNIFDDFLQTIKTTNDQLSHLLIKRWMISAIAVLFSEKSFCAQGVLVIQGKPGTHKSSFIMSLAPESMRAIKGGLSLDPAKKDDIFTSSEYWVVELGELDATFRKADIARLKSHITNDIDDVRRPHAIRNSKMIRRTVYAATVNESRFLVDETGNRRWWSISVTEPINTRHGLDMQQVWRTAYEMWLSGESPVLLEDEMQLLNESNEQYEFIDPLEEKLMAYFDWSTPNRQFMTPTQVLELIGYDKPTRNQSTKMGMLLTKLQLPKGKGKILRRSYYMPRFATNNLSLSEACQPGDNQVTTYAKKINHLKPIQDKVRDNM